VTMLAGDAPVNGAFRSDASSGRTTNFRARRLAFSASCADLTLPSAVFGPHLAPCLRLASARALLVSTAARGAASIREMAVIPGLETGIGWCKRGARDDLAPTHYRSRNTVQTTASPVPMRRPGFGLSKRTAPCRQADVLKNRGS
jgi:hypothetical protein